jgi:hypothetical protein
MKWTKKKVTVAVLLAAFFVAQAILWGHVIEAMRSKGKLSQRTDLVLHLDEATGCEYISSGPKGSLTPRLNRNGFPTCGLTK